MRNVLHLDYAEKNFNKLDKLFRGNSPLAKVTGWTKPPPEGSTDSGDEYLASVEKTRKMIKYLGTYTATLVITTSRLCSSSLSRP